MIAKRQFDPMPFFFVALCFFVLSAHPAGGAARIVTLAPSLGELVADMSADGLDRIVGVSEFSDYPPALLKKPSVGPYFRFSVEKVIGLKPDLVLATRDGNPKDSVLRLRELGLNVVVVSTASLKEVAASMRIVGDAMGEAGAGRAMAEQFERGLARIRNTGVSKEPLRILLQIGDEPLVAAGGASFVGDAVSLGGLKNIYSDSSQAYPRPAVEDVLKRNPGMILVLALGRDTAAFKRMAEKWGRFQSLEAVKRKKDFVVKGDELLRPTLRLLEGISALQRIVYGKTN
ncbi:MAG: hypothetical protein A2583_16485 [Bdellovibrionales bacterium RIFOXYD1_FULL_53_11]|nr:MAG: hypothetical protein A2583_16485 [Bdellovibrionales bacterium RIFOXYD1_FULL_53_11]